MTDAELLALRSAALNRLAEQLDAVRELHKPVRIVEDPRPWCCHCDEPHPCPTARAAGVTS